MYALLQHLHAALTSDTGLTALVPKDNIAAVLRSPADWPAIEYGIEEQTRDNRGHIRTGLVIYLYSTTGAAECWKIHDALHKLMTSENLTRSGTTGLRVSQVRLEDARTQPRNEWAASIRLFYRVWVTDPSDKSQSTVSQ